MLDSVPLSLPLSCKVARVPSCGEPMVSVTSVMNQVDRVFVPFVEANDYATTDNSLHRGRRELLGRNPLAGSFVNRTASTM